MQLVGASVLGFSLSEFFLEFPDPGLGRICPVPFVIESDDVLTGVRNEASPDFAHALPLEALALTLFRVRVILSNVRAVRGPGCFVESVLGEATYSPCGGFLNNSIVH